MSKRDANLLWQQAVTLKRFNQRAFFKAVEGGVLFKWGE